MNKAYKKGGITINFNKVEFIAINKDQIFHINIEENVTIKQVGSFKYLSVILNKKGKNSEDILSKICKGRQVIGSVWWDKNISLERDREREREKLLGKAMVESVPCYGCEVQLIEEEKERKLFALEMCLDEATLNPNTHT